MTCGCEFEENTPEFEESSPELEENTSEFEDYIRSTREKTFRQPIRLRNVFFYCRNLNGLMLNYLVLN